MRNQWDILGDRLRLSVPHRALGSHFVCDARYGPATASEVSDKDVDASSRKERSKASTLSAVEDFSVAHGSMEKHSDGCLLGCFSHSRNSYFLGARGAINLIFS